MTTELTTTNSGAGMNVMNRIAEFQQVAKIFAESGMFSDAKGAAQCFVKIMAGAELGLPPFTAMNAFHVIQGKPVMTANTIAARLKSSGKYNYRIVEKSSAKCIIDFYEGKDKVHQEVWDAQRAGRAGVKNMDKFPEAMLFARAITAGARAVAPDVVGQFYAPEELGVEVDADGVIVNAPPVFVPDPAKIEPLAASSTTIEDTTRKLGGSVKHEPAIDDKITKLVAWADGGGRVTANNKDWANGVIDEISAARKIQLNQGDTTQGRMDALVAALKQPAHPEPARDSHTIVLTA